MLEHPSTSGASGTRYRFLRSLARGGMAELYVGEAIAPGGVRRRVALKRVLPEHASDEDFSRMFLEEARLASTLQHPNIVAVFDVLKARGEFLMVMELLDGSDLRRFQSVLKRNGHGMALEHALRIVDRVLGALHYAHERTGPDHEPLGIVHRDISPHNIFLTRDGHVKLLDFGIAKATTRFGATQSGVIKGKVLYLSPEQCNGEPLDRRTDVYATGTLLYLLLAGRHPHKGDSAVDTMRQIMMQAPRPLDEVAPGLPPELYALVARAMHKERDQRFESALAMQGDLARLVRQYGLYAQDVDLARLVRDNLGPAEAIPPDESTLFPKAGLPDEIVVGETTSGTGNETTSASTLIQQDGVLLQRVAGIHVLTLSGTVDERMDLDAVAHTVDSDLVIDTSGVKRITSFGVRTLLTLGKKLGNVAVFHVRCSAAFIAQVDMMRAVLLKGKVLSFHLPFVDPADGTEFEVLVEGAEAAAVLASDDLPEATVPGSDEEAEFDENPDSYFSFRDEFLEVPPPRVAAALRALTSPDERRQIEVELGEDGTRVVIRRPLDEGYRWRRLVKSLDGAVTLDLAEVVSWDDEGVSAFARAFRAADVTSFAVQSAPVEIFLALHAQDPLRTVWKPGSMRLQALCASCSSTRQVTVRQEELPSVRRRGVLSDVCAKCAGALMPSIDLPALHDETLEEDLSTWSQSLKSIDLPPEVRGALGSETPRTAVARAPSLDTLNPVSTPPPRRGVSGVMVALSLFSFATLAGAAILTLLAILLLLLR